MADMFFLRARATERSETAEEENRVERMCPPVAMLMRVEMARAAGRKVEEVEVTSPACPSLVSRELGGRVRCQVAR